MNEAILVREGIIKWHFANTYDHQNSDVGAANRKDIRMDTLPLEKQVLDGKLLEW